MAVTSLRIELAGGLALRAHLVPTGAFRLGRSRVGFDEIRLRGEVWPPMENCKAEVRGLEMRAALLRPAAALEALFELDRLTGVTCGSVKIISGSVYLGDTPPMHLRLDHADWVPPQNAVSIRFARLDGQPIQLSVSAKKIQAGLEATPEVSVSGEWNLSGLDVTALLSRVGLTWSSRTDVGLLEFESQGDDERERGQIRISSWVLLGKTHPRPFRLAVPSVTAEFAASDTEILFESVHIDRPAYDMLGASPSRFQNLLAGSTLWSWRPKKVSTAKVDVSARHEARTRALPDTFAVRVSRLAIDSGAAMVLDRPEHTSFALKMSDFHLTLSGPATVLGRTPNTSIRFRVNDRKDMQWRAITDFSTWPPQFRLTDVR